MSQKEIDGMGRGLAFSAKTGNQCGSSIKMI